MATGGWDIAAACGTIGATVAAVGSVGWYEWRRSRRHPRLTACFDRYRVTDEGTEYSTAGQKWLRLAVTNAHGRDTASNVSAFVVECREMSVGSVSGGVIRWLANPALGWANGLTAAGTTMSIPPGVTRYVDVGTWGVHEGAMRLYLQVRPQPKSMRHVLPPGQHRITIEITPENGEPSEWEVDVSWESPVDVPTNVEATVSACAMCATSSFSRVRSLFSRSAHSA